MKVSIALFAVVLVVVGVNAENLPVVSYAYSSFLPYAYNYPQLNALNPYFYSAFPSTRFAVLPAEDKENKPKEVEIKTVKSELFEPSLKFVQPGFPLAYQYVEPTAVASSLQYHSQDALGQYQYGYSNPQSSKSEFKTFDGVTRGRYSYVDGEGKLQSVNYVSDPLGGFRVAGTNLPKTPKAVELAPPVEGAEIIEARTQHLKAHQDALELFSKSKDGAIEPKSLPTIEIAAPVESPEILEARANHLKAHVDALELYNKSKDELNVQSENGEASESE